MKQNSNLKKSVKYILALGFALLLFIIFYLITIRINQFDEIAKACDAEKNYKCSYYELKNYTPGAKNE